MVTKEETVLHLGDTAPNFFAETTHGNISFHDWIGDSWCILFSHPRDFTPVCTTELGYAARIKHEFDKRNVKMIALSVDTVENHKKWIPDINETQQTNMNYPIIGDADHHVSNLYGMIHPKASDTFTVRSVFIIDPAKKIRLMMTYPASTGRNFAEILRVLDSLQLVDQYKVATPANWTPGSDCIISPSLTDPEQLAKLFPQGYKTLKSYLRLTPDPKNDSRVKI